MGITSNIKRRINIERRIRRNAREAALKERELQKIRYAREKERIKTDRKIALLKRKKSISFMRAMGIPGYHDGHRTKSGIRSTLYGHEITKHKNYPKFKKNRRKFRKRKWRVYQDYQREREPDINRRKFRKRKRRVYQDYQREREPDIFEWW